MLLNHSGNIMSGWSNYSGKVTMYEIDESQMGNRVAKSYGNYAYDLWSIGVKTLLSISPSLMSSYVKVQRVYGNCCSGLLYFFRTSKKWAAIKMYSNGLGNQVSSHSLSKLNPKFITGFTDAEGSFMLKLTDGINGKMQPDFTIGLHIKDVALLREIKDYFGVGTLRLTNNACYWSVRNIKELVAVIIPHFDSYPLQTRKMADFLMFKKGVLLMDAKKHRGKKGFQFLVNLKASMNWGLKENSLSSFPLTNAVVRPLVSFTLPIDPHWLAGFVTGDGSFTYRLAVQASLKQGVRVRLRFNLTQHERDTALINAIMELLGCGSTYLNKGCISYNVDGFLDNINKIVPFFTDYPVLGNKGKQFGVWLKAIVLIKENKHITTEGLNELKALKSELD